MKRHLFWTPPCYFLTNSYVTSRLYKPDGCEKVILTLEVQQHDLMLMVIRHCSSKKKNQNLTSAHMRGLQHAHADVRHENDQSHRVHAKERIGNRGIAFKPSRPRDKTSFAFASSQRWNGAFENVAPKVFQQVLSKCGGESPRLIPVSPRGITGSIHASYSISEGRRRRNGGTPMLSTSSTLSSSGGGGDGSGRSGGGKMNFRRKFDLTKHLEELSLSRILPPTLKSPRPTLADLRRVTPRRKEPVPVVEVEVPYVFSMGRR